VLYGDSLDAMVLQFDDPKIVARLRLHQRGPLMKEAEMRARSNLDACREHPIEMQARQTLSVLRYQFGSVIGRTGTRALDRAITALAISESVISSVPMSRRVASRR